MVEPGEGVPDEPNRPAAQMTRGLVATIALIAAVLVAFALFQGEIFGTPTPSALASASIAAPSPTGRPPSSPASPRPSSTPADTSVGAAGVVVPVRSADLAARLSGIVAATYVHDGSEAESGQLLVKLDQATYLAAVDVAEADLRRAEATVAQAQLQLEQLPSDASPGQIEAVQANVRVAEAERDLAQSTVSEAQVALQQTEIRAPFAGTIADITVTAGEQAIAGETLLTIGDTSGWLIETIDLSELEVVRVAVGDRASISFEALPGRTIDGTVERIQLRGSDAEGGVAFAVAVRPDVIPDELRWGMSATVRIRPSG